MIRYVIIGAVVLLVVPVLVLVSFRIYKDIVKKRGFANTYAIQNVGSGKDLRVRDAGCADGTAIVLYHHHEWECMTWRLIELEEGTFLLQNLYTQKGFQPSATPADQVGLEQRSLGGTPLQHWEFLKQPDGTFLIRLKDTGWYLTAASTRNNAPVVLAARQESDSQSWRLVRQTPVF